MQRRHRTESDSGTESMDANRIVLSFNVVHHRRSSHNAMPPLNGGDGGGGGGCARFASLVELIYHSLNKLYWVIDLSCASA